MKRDSVDKIFYYLDNITQAEEVVISDKLNRDYSCPEGCGGCCFKVTLDYIEGSERWEKFKSLYPDKIKDFKLRQVKGVNIWSDLQEENSGNYCKHLDPTNGRCNIHEANPFPCAFDLIKVIYNKGTKKTNILVRKHGRGWGYKRVDGQIGAKCEMLETKDQVPNHYKMLAELKQIGEKFGYSINLNTTMPTVQE